MPAATPATPATSAVRDALADAVAVRERWRGCSPDDPARVAELQAVLGSLQASWTPELRAYMRSGERVARSVSADEVHVLSRERRAEIKRLRVAIDRTSGTPRHARSPENGGPAPSVDAASIRGTLREFSGFLKATATEHEALRAVLGGGGPRRGPSGGIFRSMADLNDKAQELADRLQRKRRRVRSAWDTFVPDFSTYRGNDDLRDLAERYENLQDEARRLAVALRTDARRRTPLRDERPRRRARWTEDDVRAALDLFEQSHGRPPTKVELNRDPGLPFYTTVHRVLGARPLSSVD